MDPGVAESVLKEAHVGTPEARLVMLQQGLEQQEKLEKERAEQKELKRREEIEERVKKLEQELRRS